MKKIMIDKKAITLFILVFAIATVALVPTRLLVSKLTSKTIFNTDEGTVLSEDMVPITVDQTSPFYAAFKDSSRVNFLLLGVADKNTDTIMMCSYDKDAQTVDIISVPRDTYYARSGYKNYAYNKINSIYRTEGVVGVATAVSKLLYGMPIHYYAIVDYNDIKKVIDVIGGVEVEVPFHMKYDDPYAEPELHIDIPAGTQLITSENVEEYLRFRHGNEGYQSYYNGDLGRIQTQQEFVKLTIKKILETGKYKEVIKVALQNIESDITYTAAIKLAASAVSGLSMENVTAQRLPGSDATLHNLSFWMIDDTQVYDLLTEMLVKNTESETTTSDGAISTETSK